MAFGTSRNMGFLSYMLRKQPIKCPVTYILERVRYIVERETDLKEFDVMTVFQIIY